MYLSQHIRFLHLSYRRATKAQVELCKCADSQLRAFTARIHTFWMPADEDSSKTLDILYRWIRQQALARIVIFYRHVA